MRELGMPGSARRRRCCLNRCKGRSLNMRRPNRKWRLAAAIAVVLIGYCAPYAVYRFVYPEAVLEYVGGHVIRPSFLGGAAPVLTPDFTFDGYSRSFGTSFLSGSFVSQSLVTKLASDTGWDIAGRLNDGFYPLARLDHLFTGRYCRFQNVGWVPFSTRPGAATSAMEIDLSGSETGDFEGFINRRP